MDLSLPEPGAHECILQSQIMSASVGPLPAADAAFMHACQRLRGEILLAPAGPSVEGNGSAALDMRGLAGALEAARPPGQRFVPPSPATASGRGGGSAGHRSEWAVRGGVPNLAAEWEQLRPNLAHRFPFELDTFQKEAIIHIEQVRLAHLCPSTLH